MRRRGALALCAALAWHAGAGADYERDRGLVRPPQESFLSGKVLRVYPGRTSIGRSPGERNCTDLRTEQACIARYGKPQERRPAPGGGEVLVYHGPRQLWRGLAGEQAPAGRERTEHVVRNGRVVREYQIVQVVERGYSFAPSPPEPKCEASGLKWPVHCHSLQPLEPPPPLLKPPAPLLEGRSDKALLQLYMATLYEPACEGETPGFAARMQAARSAGDPRDVELARWMRTTPEYVEDLASLSAMRGRMDAGQLRSACSDMLAMLAGPDARFATPEQTWQTYLDALRRGDADGALECLDPVARRNWEVLKTLPVERLKAMAEAIKGIAMTGLAAGEFREAVVARHDGQAGMVYFVQQGRNWKIRDM